MMGQTQQYQHVPAPKPQNSMMSQSSLHQMMMPQQMMTQPPRINDQTMQLNLQGGVMSTGRQTQPLQPAPMHRQPAPTIMSQQPTGQQIGAPQMRPPMTQQYNHSSMEKSHHTLPQQLSHGYDSTVTLNRQQSNQSLRSIVGQQNSYQN